MARTQLQGIVVIHCKQGPETVCAPNLVSMVGWSPKGMHYVHHPRQTICPTMGKTLMRTPPKGDQIGEVSDNQRKHQDSEEQTIMDFLEQLVQANMCSMALVPASERKDTIKSIVNDIGLQAPNALRKLSLMIKGGGLD